MVLDERGTQTQVKHRILSQYMAAWRGIIIGGLSRTAKVRLEKGLPFRSRFLYVDGFSFKGRYDIDLGQNEDDAAPEAIWGSPILGVQAMDLAREHAQKRFGFPIETGAILVEIDQTNFDSLLQSLRLAGVDQRRIVINPSNIDPADSQVVVINGDFLNYYRDVLTCLKDRYTKGFVLLDPYGMKGIPYQMVRQFVALPNADVMINWPYLDIQRKRGHLNSVEERPSAQANVANINEMFGTETWQPLCGVTLSAGLPDELSAELERSFANLYEDQLQKADSTVTVKRVPLQFSESDRTIYYLFLTTHDPTGALELNQVLDEAHLWEFGVRWHLRQDRYVRWQESVGQPSLFDIMPLMAPPQSQQEREVDIQALAIDIFRTWSGQTSTRKEVYRRLADTSVYANEVNRALTWLKQQELARFNSTKLTEPMTFAKKVSSP